MGGERNLGPKEQTFRLTRLMKQKLWVTPEGFMHELLEKCR